VNIAVLTDLLVLASGEHFYRCETIQGKMSGFSQLAESLRSNPRVLQKLIH